MSYHIYEDSINNARRLNKTKEYRISQRMRKRIEELFGEAKEFMGLRVAKFRRTKFVREQILMTATAQNIKRMVKLLSKMGPKGVAVSAQQPQTLPLINGLLKLFAFLSQNIKGIFITDRQCFVKS